MIRLNKASVAFPIPWASDVHFMLRAGDVIERGELEADLAEHRAGRVFDFQLTEAFESGCDALLDGRPEDMERIREAVAAEQDGETLSKEDAAGLALAREAVQSSWPPYRTLTAQAARRNELVPTLAFQRFCTGWAGEGLPDFEKSPDGLVSLEVMGRIEPVLLRMAGMRAYQMLYSTGEEKNSEPPLQSDKSPRPSTSDKSKKVGKSAKTTGRKTRSSTSARGSSRSSTSGLIAAS